MTTSSVTSIEKYILQKNLATGRNRRCGKTDKESVRSGDDGAINARQDSWVHESDRYDQLIGRLDEIESRLTRQNQLAVTIRGADHYMQQVGIRIENMQNALKKVIDPDPPCFSESEARIAQIRKAGTIREEIEALTAASPTDGNVAGRIKSGGFSELRKEAPETADSEYKPDRDVPGGVADDHGSMISQVPLLADDAEDGDIKTTLVQLRKAGAIVQRKRQELRFEASRRWQENDPIDENQVAEQKSLFIGKHLSRNANGGITSTSSILKGFLNSPWV